LAELTLLEVELDVYGVSGDLCVVEIAGLRASPSAIDELNGGRGVEEALPRQAEA
jgi:hypothetical protein